MSRTQEIAKAILGKLKEWDTEVSSPVLHAGIEGHVFPFPSEGAFKEALTFCTDEKLVVLAEDHPLRGKLYMITTRGKGTLIK